MALRYSGNRMQIRALKYLMIFSNLVPAILGFTWGGPWAFALPLYAFSVLPLIEFLVPPDPKNLSEAEMELARQDKIYDFLLYLVVPAQYFMLFLFFRAVTLPDVPAYVLVGHVVSMGIMCGVMGINVAHELGHRKAKHERVMAKLLLLSSLYMHFIIDHNRGHHVRVSTPDDPSSARFGEMLYIFWIRSMWGCWLSAWEIEGKLMKQKGYAFWSIHNEMLRFQLIQAAALAGVGIFIGYLPMLLFFAAALIGGLLLETVNYIEHYGLLRKQLPNGRYEPVQPLHSWNSDHIMGRLLLFELSRHSDHHYRASRKYQILRHVDESPQMPTGYPGMVLLAHLPPLWFRIMNPRVRKAREAAGVETPQGK